MAGSCKRFAHRSISSTARTASVGAVSGMLRFAPQVVRILTTMSETVPFTDAKAHLSDLVDRVVREHERFVVTRNGRPAVVLVNPEDLESLEETVEILQDKELLESIRKSRREAAEGKRLRLKDHV